MKKFAGFTPKQQYTLLSKQGYTGPADEASMAKFLAASPGAASKMGEYAQIAQQRLAGKPMPTQAMFLGGMVEDAEARKKMLAQQGQMFGFGARQEQAKGTSPAPLKTELNSRTQKEAGDFNSRPEVISAGAAFNAAREKLQSNYISQFGVPSDAASSDSMAKSIGEKLKASPEAAQLQKLQTGNQVTGAPQSNPVNNTDKFKLLGALLGGGLPEGTTTTPGPFSSMVRPIPRTADKVPEVPAFAPTTDRAPIIEAQNKAIEAARAEAADPENELLKKASVDTAKALTEAKQNYSVAQAQQQLSTPTAFEVAGTTLTDPGSLVQKASVTKIGESADTIIDSEEGQAAAIDPAVGTSVTETEQATAPDKQDAVTVEATKVAGTAPEATAAQGQVSDQAQVTAAEGTLSEGAIAEALGMDPMRISQVISGELKVTPEQLAKAATALNIPEAEVAQFLGQVPQAEAATFDTDTPEAVAQDQFTLTPTQVAKQEVTKVQDAAKAAEMPTAEEARTNFQSTVEAAKGSVGAKELVSAKDIVGASKAVETVAATVKALDSAAIASAAQGTFSQQALAKVEQGEVTAKATVQGQMSELMNQFNNGTPSWAAGAVRAANAAMAARGLGGSSMAGAAIVQAAMESALPIAAQDAQTFAQMNLTNLNNRQQVALTNAAAQQNLELANLSNRQQVALQNSSNSFALQSQNLSNSQAVVIANAQLKASFQGQTLNITAQTALTNAARYAESNNINLSNQQQSNLQRSAENLQVDMVNLSNTQQTALSNLQVRAALVGQELSNEQQMAMLQSSQDFERAGFDATAKQQAFIQDAQARAALEGRALDARQQTALFNVSNVIQERGIELSNEQQTNLFNTSNNLQVDLANLSNKQQTYLANAQIEASLRGQELTNAQQTAIVNAGRFSEAANITFTAEQQSQLHNSELLKTVGIAELNAKQATALQNSATIAGMDMANLDNRQQAAVQNAQSFLQMDLTDVNNEQQTSMFNTQSKINFLLSDQAADNAAKQFNAASQNQTDQFFAELGTTVSRFNAEQKNAINQFNAGEANALEKFNTQVEAQRDQFNANNSLIIAQANAQWRQNVDTLDTAAENEATREAAKVANGYTQNTVDEIWQRERDIMASALTTAEGDANRNVSLMLGDKEAQALANVQRAKDQAAKSQVITEAVLDIFL